MANTNLSAAKKAKKDEFYTQLADINAELRHYAHHFAGKVVFCNCDDPYESNFFKYFAANFNALRLKLEWISQGAAKQYMALHQHDTTAMAEWLYFKGVIDWVQTLFPKYRREMKGLDWGGMFRLYGKGKYDPAEMEKDIQRLMADDDVQRKGGIYEYLLSGGEQESALSIRKFTDSQKRAAYERQGGTCADCGKPCAFEEMHGDHVTPWSKGGHTVPDNLQMLCRTCNLRKGAR